MILGHHALPTARKTDGEVDRYVLSEYGEKGSGWFSISCSSKRNAWTTARTVATTAASAPVCKDMARADRCCPVLKAISQNAPSKGMTSRGGIAGEL